MKKYLVTIIISLVIGFLLSNYILKQYDDKIIPVFGGTTNVYLIQQGVYSNMKSMQDNTSKIADYIYMVKDNLYYVYVGMTLDNNNATKLQTYFENKGLKTIIKNISMTDKTFLKSLEEFDKVIKETNDDMTIKEICKQILSKYKGEENENKGNTH
ncbi:MAG: hypothetical protein RSB71_01095 [Bacilli bacterium]